MRRLRNPGDPTHGDKSMRTAFIAYAGDCRVSGQVDSESDERLTDMLNRQSALTIHQAQLSSHVDGHVVELDEITLDRSDLFAIDAPDARSERSRRLHTVRHRIEIQLGPYAVLGQLHTLPGGRPLVTIGQRGPMIPLTNATIAYNDGARVVAQDVGTLIVNRELVTWVRAEASDLEVFGNVASLRGSTG